jgi:hypothetical protein
MRSIRIKGMKNQVNEELDDLSKDFKVLSVEGRRAVLRIAKTLLKVQKESKNLIENAVLPSANKGKKLIKTLRGFCPLS